MATKSELGHKELPFWFLLLCGKPLKGRRSAYGTDGRISVVSKQKD